MAWIRCPHCDEKRDTSGRYTSPTNAKRDHDWWLEEHISGRCVLNDLSTEDAARSAATRRQPEGTTDL
ncbi:hypothetical protein GCM10029976_067560 [Kribbella albertanoniae]